MSCFLDGWLKTEKSVHWLIHVRSHRSSISCHFHCPTNFSISNSLILGLQIVHSSNFEYKLAFSSTKSNFSLTFSCLPQFTYFAPPHFVLFSLHHHHHLISIVFHRRHNHISIDYPSPPPPHLTIPLGNSKRSLLELQVQSLIFLWWVFCPLKEHILPSHV